MSLNIKALKAAAEKALVGGTKEADPDKAARLEYTTLMEFEREANIATILELVERVERMQKALGVFGRWAIDVSTLRTLEQLEAAMNEAGVSLQQVGEWSALNPKE